MPQFNHFQNFHFTFFFYFASHFDPADVFFVDFVVVVVVVVAAAAVSVSLLLLLFAFVHIQINTYIHI